MKTLVVLSALAVFAIAAPAPPPLEQGFEDISFASSEEKTPELREKKSPSEDFTFPNADSDTSSLDSQSSALSASGRTLIVKKPIIVKKKIGYHLYRNSDEEEQNTGSRESCMERVKVKLCNEKMLPKSMMRSSTHEDPNIMSEDEMKHSIIMAKEAVEILQRDLKRLEDKTGVPLIQDRNSDTGLHEDIEIARQALEHVHKSFDNLESMDVGTIAKDAEISHDIHSTDTTVPNNEEERLVQWKEAMHNIQKNMEIAKNIEDSFRFASNNVLSDEHDMTSASNNEGLENNLNSQFSSMEQEMRMTSNLDTSNHKSNKHDTLENTVRTTEELLNQSIEKDMDKEGSASNVIEFKTDNTQTSDCKKGDNYKIESSQKNLKEKSSDFDLSITHGSKQGQFVSMPKEFEKIERLSDYDQNDSFKMSDNMMDSSVDASTNQMMFMKSDFTNQRNKQDENKQDLKTFNNHEEKRFSQFAESMDPFSRNNAKLGADLMKSDKKFILDSEQSTDMKSKNALPSKKNKEHTLPNNDAMNNFDKVENIQFTENGQRSKMIMFTNKAAEDMQTFSNEHKALEENEENENLHNKAAKKVNDMTDNESVKSGESQPSFLDQTKSRQFIQPGLNVATSGQVIPAQSSKMINLLMRGQTNEMDWEMQPSQHMSMRDSTGMKPDRLFRWKPTHESSRSGFGAPIVPASSGAMAVYPNAHANGCSIPLLVSCAPSVVSGSMTKVHPSYAVPAYRTDEEMGFPIKREVKKPNDITLNTEKDKAPNIKQSKSKTNDNKN